MIEKDDVRAAVGAGVITEAQAAALVSLSDSRRGVRETLEAGDEPFELFKGFNEIFIVIGLGILSFGWVGIALFLMLDNLSSVRNVLIGTGIVGGGVLWMLSEYFIRRRRMIAPAIALTLLFAVNAAYGFAGAFAQLIMVSSGDYSSMPLPFALATLALLAFWLRFRVPFALAVIAVAVFGVSILVTVNSNGAPDTFADYFLLSADGPFALLTLGLGLIAFAIAMRFDMSDPHRVTRRAANGFWLHVVAAPALVNTMALSLLNSDAAFSHLWLVVLLGGVAMIAIIIDRRSFLIAAIGYTVILSNTVFDAQSAVFTVFGLGVVLVLLGARWEAIRARLMSVLPRFIPRDRLPPSA